jgi:hypothetical protein
MKTATAAQMKKGLRVHTIVYVSSMAVGGAALLSHGLVVMKTAAAAQGLRTHAIVFGSVFAFWGIGLLSHWLGLRGHLAREAGRVQVVHNAER